MRPSNPPRNVALHKNLESVVIAAHLLEKTPATSGGYSPVGLREDCFWCPLSHGLGGSRSRR